MIILKIKNRDELKAKASDANILGVCGTCPLWNFSRDEIEELGDELNAKVEWMPMICNRYGTSISTDGTIFILACGAGVQVVSEALNKTVIPVADTSESGVKNEDDSI